MEIQYHDRASGSLKTEKIYSEASFRFLYENPVGYFLTQKFLVKPWFSRAYGNHFSKASSIKKIPDFVSDHQIEIDDFEDRNYVSFNDFFARKFKEGVRSFSKDPKVFPAICEGRVLAFSDLSDENELPVKAQLWRAKELAPFEFDPGSVLIFRLSPADYHRFHSPDEGRLIQRTWIEGRLDSVNPLSLRRNREVFLRNRRVCYQIETKNFGHLTCVAVAGLCVGSINDSFRSDRLERGQEMGFFEFGGSTVIIFGEKGKWLPSADLLKNTKVGLETFVRLGESVGNQS